MLKLLLSEQVCQLGSLINAPKTDTCILDKSKKFCCPVSNFDAIFTKHVGGFYMEAFIMINTASQTVKFYRMFNLMYDKIS